ncbi:MAG: cupin domain-containing protein [Steroidobacteraceae bacterium]|jgi:mannose-6-phosphate isomerase-like protein (cupin superfamily)|nr:cupin domain-containing protein [Steroidobacteraceae bacterium]
MTVRKAMRVSRRLLLRSAASAGAAGSIALVGGAAAAAADAAGAAQAGAAARGAPPAPPPRRTPDGRWTRIRRVVTTDDASGRGIVVADGEPGNALELNGTRIVRLWESAGLPVPLPLQGDAGATAGNAYREGFQGTSFYVAELPGGARAPSIPMHRNATLDYMAILSGRIVFKMQDREIELGAGDTLVQGGNEHSWINRWDEPCLLLFVVVSGASRSA